MADIECRPANDRSRVGHPATNATRPEAQKVTLDALRAEIDAIDHGVVPLLARRIELVRSAAPLKSSPDDVRAPARVADVLARVRARAAEAGTDPEWIEGLYRRIISDSINLELEEFNGGAPSPPQPAAAEALLFDTMAEARAVRYLKPDPVPDHILRELVRAATLGPSAANRQAFGFVVVTDRKQMARIARVWRAAVAFYTATAGRDAPPGVEQASHERLLKAMRHQSADLTKVPAIIAVCYRPRSLARQLLASPRRSARAFARLGPRRAWTMSRRLGTWAARAGAASTYPAVENLLLAAHAHGLGATLTTMHSGLEPEVKAILDVPSDTEIASLIPIGYPARRLGAKRRRPVDEVLHFDRWHGSRRPADVARP